MVQKIFYKNNFLPLTCVFFAIFICATSIAEEVNQPKPRTVELKSSQEFSFVQQTSTTFTIRPLRSQLRSIENLKDTEAVGLIYLGNIILGENSTPLNALRDLSVQISKGLNIDLALITDSTTSQSVEPHELLLLYHPQLVITLALTKNQDSDEYSLIGTYAIPVISTPKSVGTVSQETQE